MKPLGEPVIAAGFSLFSENDNVQPTVTRGIVTHVSNPVAVLQTSCCIQSGASGGALFRCTGDLVGIISCNVMDTSSKALFPRINMAVPASVLAEPLNAFLRTGGKGQNLYIFETGKTKVSASERPLASYKSCSPKHAGPTPTFSKYKILQTGTSLFFYIYYWCNERITVVSIGNHGNCYKQIYATSTSSQCPPHDFRYLSCCYHRSYGIQKYGFYVVQIKFNPNLSYSSLVESTGRTNIMRSRYILRAKNP